MDNQAVEVFRHGSVAVQCLVGPGASWATVSWMLAQAEVLVREKDPCGTPCGTTTPPEEVDGSRAEKVLHPDHYGGVDNPYEAIKVIEAMGWGEGFALGSALKYMARAGKKPGEDELLDAEKARWYLNRRVVQLGGEDWSPDAS